MSCIVSLYENFLDTDPHWALSKHTFSSKIMSLKKDNPKAPPTNIVQLCGGRLGLQIKKTVTYVYMKWPNTIKGWQQNWFYCDDVAMSDGSVGLSPYTPDRVTKLPSWNPRLTKGKKVEVSILTDIISVHKDQGLVENDVVAAWVSHRIQPLQSRDRPMYTYKGINDHI